MKVFVAALAATLALAAPAVAQPAADPAPAAAKTQRSIDFFFGIFQGDTTVVEGPSAGTEAAGRMSRVETVAAGNGFTITWSTVYTDDDNPSEIKIKDSTVITFTPTATAGVYQQKDPGKLWAGKPYYWARIDGDTLHVSALVLDADGTYDVTHYARTVQDDTMRLEFTRFKDGLLQRHVTGTLRKVAE